MNATQRRWIGWGGALGVLVLLGGCATGPYDDYGYGDDYYYGGGPAVYGGVDVYRSSPRYYPNVRPGYPYYAPGYRNDNRWRGDRRARTPRAVAVPVPVPVPTPSVRPPRMQPPVARPNIQYPGGRTPPTFHPSPFGGGAVTEGGRPVPQNLQP